MIGRGRIIRAVDLFCGGGGTTTGMLAAARGLGLRLDLVAVNHWLRAIETHLANHPWARHICASLTSIDPPADGQKTIFQCVDAIRPEEATGGRKLDLLVASPECTDHSNAKGGRPRNDQSRATAWCILRWADTVRPSHVLVENVPEFVNWGPLGARGEPLKSKRGRLFKAFLEALDALGYRVEWRILNAADYGDATTRRRFFLQAVRGRRRLTWPDPSHAPADKAQALGLEPWRPARDVIDWRLEGGSIFRRKRPLAPNTLRRIAKGIEKYWGEWARPFLLMLYGTNDARSIERPVPTVTGAGQHIGLAEPFLLAMNYTASAEHDGRYTRDVGEPLATVTSQGNRFGLAEPMMIPQHGGGAARPVGDPLPTIAGAGAISVVEPFLVPQFGERPGQDPRTHPVGEPLPAVTSHGAGAVVEPGLVRDEAGNVYALDIRFRMLQPAELAAAMSFPEGYTFAGNKSEQVRQIGNAVAVRTATALCREALGA